MGLAFTYMVFNLFILTRYGTSPHTCTLTIFPSSVNLIHMVVSPLNGSHFHPGVFSWWLLELTCFDTNCWEIEEGKYWRDLYQ